MDEYEVLPTVPRITVGATKDTVVIKQYWEVLNAGLDNSQINIPRKLFIPFLEELLARMDCEEIVEAQKSCAKWQDIIAFEEQEALSANQDKQE